MWKEWKARKSFVKEGIVQLWQMERQTFKKIRIVPADSIK